MGMIVDILRDRQYSVRIDGSRRITVRNRRHLRKIEAPNLNIKLKEDDKEENESPEWVPATPTPVFPNTSGPVFPDTPTAMAPVTELVPELETDPEPAPKPEPIPEVPRRSSRTTSPLSRLEEVTGYGKFYAMVVKMNREEALGRGVVTISKWNQLHMRDATIKRVEP